MQLKEQLQRAQHDVEAMLNRYFDQPLNTEQTIKDATHYGVLNGGKRLRPYLVYATGRMMGANKADLDVLAAAIECIHSYSLVHDDLPAMDDDDMRRGKPSCHKAYDEATAVLVGDALQSLAFEILDNIDMVKVLARAAGPAGMVGGQMLDIEQSKDLKRVHLLKTAKLFEAAALMGAVAANCSEAQKKQISEFALNAGMAFQIKDDLDDGDSTLDPAPYFSALDNADDLKQRLAKWQDIALG